MNSSKTKIMSSNEKVGWLQIDELRIEKVTEYIYLGQIITLDNKTNMDIGRCIANGWKSYWPQKNIFKSKMSIPTKIKIFHSCIIPVLTYGSQTWALTKKNVQRLKSTYYTR